MQRNGGRHRLPIQRAFLLVSEFAMSRVPRMMLIPPSETGEKPPVTEKKLLVTVSLLTSLPYLRRLDKGTGTLVLVVERRRPGNGNCTGGTHL